MLNRVQQIGVKHFDDFVERMQREEVAEIEAKVVSRKKKQKKKHNV